MADMTSLFDNMKLGMKWIFSLFKTFVDTIIGNDLLLYPVVLFIVLGAVGLVITIIRRFGLRSRRS